MNTVLQAEDYQEPACPLCMNTDAAKAIPIKRIIDKLDEHLNRNDYESAEQHLNYWLTDAATVGDERGKLTLINERMGLYRKLGRKAEALADATTGIELLSQLEIQNSITAGTTYLNAATVYKAFGAPEQAVSLYEKTLDIYKETLPPKDSLFGGLYNNMALVLVDLQRFDQANDYYIKALNIMKDIENGELEQAITYLNMADAVAAQFGRQEADDMINRYINNAESLLETSHLPRNGYYAFVAEKCAPTFRFYGYFAYANELEKRARRIYEGA